MIQNTTSTTSTTSSTSTTTTTTTTTTTKKYISVYHLLHSIFSKVLQRA